MKAVAFVCLLLLSLGLCQPTPLPDAHPSQEAAKTDNKTNLTKQAATVQSTVSTAVDVKLLSDANDTNHAQASPPSSIPNETKPSDGKPQVKANTTEPVTEASAAKQNASKPTEPAKKDNKETASGEVKPVTPKTNEEGKAAGADNSTVTPATEKAATEKMTEAPKDTTEKPLVGKRAFDGPSFIGGIILTLGLLAIGFMGFKYYKNQTERNYHTL